jgi:putative ABC transport system ATP-binding protein
LADEPTAALDSHTGKNVMEMMSELAHKRDRAVVIVTHDSRVLSFADRVVKIEDGTIADADATLMEPVPAGILAHNFLQGTMNPA